MYRVIAVAPLGLSFLLLLTDATMAYADVTSSIAMPGSALLISLPSALAIILATIGRKILRREMETFRESDQNYYEPLMRMVRVLDRKDAHDQMMLGA